MSLQTVGSRWYQPSQNELTATAGAGGTATVRTVAVPENHVWSIDMVVVATGSAAAGEALVYTGEPGVSSFVCGSQAGNNDTADGAPITLLEGQYLSIGWTGQVPGSTCIARLHLTDQVFTPGASDTLR